jgi:hypothetical protein
MSSAHHVIRSIADVRVAGAAYAECASHRIGERRRVESSYATANGGRSRGHGWHRKSRRDGMFRVFKTVVDPSGDVVTRMVLPFAFETVIEANDFMDVYVPAVFEGGTSGYQDNDDYWWGCDATEELTIHRYIVEFGGN